MRRIRLICRSTSNVISRLCEKTIKRKCVNIKNESTFWKIWTFSYSSQLIDSILFISEIKRRFIRNYQRWRNVSRRRIEFENSRWFANTRICWALKHQQMNQWLLNWKKIYAKTKRLNLFDVQNDRCVYDFLNSLRTMNLSFVFDRKTIFNHEMNQKKSSTSIRNLLEEFRNHLRIARTLITKRTTHEAFATLQEKSSNDETTDQEKESEKFSNQKFENRSCLCDRKHSFNECYYLIEELRSTEWKSNEEMMKKIEKILETNSRIRTTVKWARKNVKRRLKKIIEKENDSDDESSRKKSFFDDEVTLNVSFAKTFAKR